VDEVGLHGEDCERVFVVTLNV